MRPHINCEMANAKLMVPMPSPVELLRGEMKSPRDCLAPIVTMRMAAAASVTTHAVRLLPSLLDDMPCEDQRSAAAAMTADRVGADNKTAHIQFLPQLVSLSTWPAAPLKRCNGN